MAAIFRPWHNTAVKISLIVVATALGGGVGGLMVYARSPLATRMQDPVEQPVQFDHRHHVGDLGIDCRYCHDGVETSPRAGIPAVSVCMNCHVQVWNKSPILEPVREAYFKNQPILWNRVYKLPDFVYFDHSIHVAKGVGCVECHGRVDKQPAIEKMQPMSMTFCLDCHRAPEGRIRTVDQVTNMKWSAHGNPEISRTLAKEYDVHTRTTCTTCHR